LPSPLVEGNQSAMEIACRPRRSPFEDHAKVIAVAGWWRATQGEELKWRLAVFLRRQVISSHGRQQLSRDAAGTASSPPTNTSFGYRNKDVTTWRDYRFNCTGALPIKMGKSTARRFSAPWLKGKYREAAIYDRKGQVFARIFRWRCPRQVFAPSVEGMGVFYKRHGLFREIMMSGEKIGTVTSG